MMPNCRICGKLFKKKIPKQYLCGDFDCKMERQRRYSKEYAKGYELIRRANRLRSAERREVITE